MKLQSARNQVQVINNCKVQWLTLFHHKLFPPLWSNKTWWIVWSLLTWFKKMDGLVGSWECLLYCSRSLCSEVHLFWSLCELLPKKKDKSISHFRLHGAGLTWFSFVRTKKDIMSLYWHRQDSKAHLCAAQVSRAALALDIGGLTDLSKISLGRKACQLVELWWFNRSHQLRTHSLLTFPWWDEGE